MSSDAFKANLHTKATHLLEKIFPDKVLSLDSLLHSKTFQRSPKEIVETFTGIPVPAVPTKKELKLLKKPRLDDSSHGSNGPDQADNIDKIPISLPQGGVVRANPKIVELIRKLQPEVLELMEHANSIKLWIQLLMPKMEDGDNFGVEVQEQAAAEVKEVEATSTVKLAEIIRYYTLRADAIANVMKNPYLEDYRRSVQEVDKIQYMLLRKVVIDLRNDYSTLVDVISKNMDKIIMPRHANHSVMF